MNSAQPTLTPSSPPSPWLPLVVFGLLYLLNSLGRPFAVPDEARYVSIAADMAQTGDYLTPYLNGIKYFEKPPLFYWLQALIFEVLPVNHFTGRLGVGLCALATLFVVYYGLWALTRHQKNAHQIAWQGALITATSLLFFVMGHIVTLDMLLTFCITLCLMGFAVAQQLPPGRQRRLWMYGATLGAALGILAKGLVALALPGLIVVLWLTACGGWRRLLPLYLPTCLVLLLLITVPWHAMMMEHHPEFGWFYFVNEHFLRYTTTVHRRTGGWWMGLAVTAVGMMPWVWAFGWRMVAWMRGLVRFQAQKTDPLEVFFFIWLVAIVTFFSISQSKLIPYFLPAIPAGACWLALVWSRPTQAPCGRDYAGQIGVFAIMVGAAVGGYFGRLDKSTPAQLNALVAIGLICGVLAILGYVWWRRYPQGQRYFAHTAVVGIMLNVAISFLGPVFQRPSAQEAAHFIKSLNPQAVYQSGFYIYDFGVYYGQPVPLHSGCLGELEYGYTHHKGPLMILNQTQFAERWAQGIAKKIRQCSVLRKVDYPSYGAPYAYTKLYTFPPYVVMCSSPEKDPLP